jgi:hypothetical protein
LLSLRQCLPMPLDWLAGERVSQVACSMDTAVALSEDGAIHVWGRKKQLLTASPLEGAVARTTRRKSSTADGGQQQPPWALAEEEIRGEAVGDLTANVMMNAACGEGFCVLLAEREVGAAPKTRVPQLCLYTFHRSDDAQFSIEIISILNPNP